MKEGADINQKLPMSLLKRVSYFDSYTEDFVPLTETLFELSATVDYSEYGEGSPLHDILHHYNSIAKKLQTGNYF